MSEETIKVTRKELLKQVKKCNNENHRYEWEFDREKNQMLLSCDTEGLNIESKETEDK